MFEESGYEHVILLVHGKKCEASFLLSGMKLLKTWDEELTGTEG